MRSELGITVILVSHSMEDVAEYVERMIVLDNGEILFDAPPREVFGHHRSLEEIGLAAPQVTYLMEELAKSGMPVSTGAVTVQEAAQEIVSVIGNIR